MKSYFGYIRVSTPRQGRGVSLDEQRSAILAYATRHNFKIAEWFVETETAAKQGRTEYTKMIRGLESGKAVGVIIHKIDRGARNMKDWANLGELIDAGVDVQFVHESLDLRSRGGRLAADIQAVVAADYIRNLRDEVLKGFYGRLKQGVYPLPAPVGYLDQGAGVPKAVDAKTGPLVRYAFERYANGDISLRTLCGELSVRGLKTNRGKSISVNGLAGMLHNQFYTGIIHIERRGETFQGAHVPLVTRELFDRVQAVLAGKHVPTAKKHAFQFRGLVRHIGCTRRLTGEIAKGRFVYYRCHGPACRGVAVTEKVLHAAIKAKLDRVACSPEDLQDLRDLVEDERARAKADASRDEGILKLRINECNERLARLTDALLDGIVTKETFNNQNARLLADRRGLEDKLASLHGESRWYQQYQEFVLKNPKLLRFDGLVGDETRDLIRDVCSDLGLEKKKPVITLQSPYREIENTALVTSSGPSCGDVRTHARKILDVLLTLHDQEAS